MWRLPEAVPRAWRPAEEAFTNLVLQKSVVSFSTILRRSKYELVGSDEVLSSKTKLCIESGQFGIDFIYRIASFVLEMFSRGFSRRTAWCPYVQRSIWVVGVPPRLVFWMDAGRSRVGRCRCPASAFIQPGRMPSIAFVNLR